MPDRRTPLNADPLGGEAVPDLESLLEPSDAREPYYDGPDLNRPYSWPCSSCDATVSVSLAAVQRASFSWSTAIPEPLANHLHSHFRIGPQRAHGGGSVSLLVTECSSCAATFAVYASVDEYRNSVYSIHIQGVVRVAA